MEAFNALIHLISVNNITKVVKIIVMLEDSALKQQEIVNA
jgi:hypothetical protein